MIISIRLPSHAPSPEHPLPSALADIGNNETAIIDLQGSIEIEGDYTSQAIGTLDMTHSAKPMLRVGHHLLEGKVVSLPKPLAVLKTIPNNDEDARSPISFDMVAIIRKKLIFSKRPSPVVNHVPKEEAQEPSKRKRAA